jgi:hypothetical protein
MAALQLAQTWTAEGLALIANSHIKLSVYLDVDMTLEFITVPASCSLYLALEYISYS